MFNYFQAGKSKSSYQEDYSDGKQKKNDLTSEILSQDSKKPIEKKSKNEEYSIPKDIPKHTK